MGCMRQRVRQPRDRGGALTVRFEVARGGVVRLVQQKVGEKLVFESWSATPGSN